LRTDVVAASLKHCVEEILRRKQLPDFSAAEAHPDHAPRGATFQFDGPLGEDVLMCPVERAAAKMQNAWP
jgi:hypothetical protein